MKTLDTAKAQARIIRRDTTFTKLALQIEVAISDLQGGRIGEADFNRQVHEATQEYERIKQLVNS